MTYFDSYMQCETLSELTEEVKKDIAQAIIINPDRLKHIKNACEEVANLKFGGEVRI